jgi:23S rRNA (adenine2503-C2)-methyltransferase
MSYEDRVTVCVSSQAGCAMGCTFCATGQAGFTRQLTAGEVLEQVMFAARAAAPRRLSNVVFMGMGEPLANYRVTVEAVRRLHEYRGLSARHLTVSTVGVAPAIERLAKEGLPLTLAVSLHAANNETRNELVPLNRRYPLERLHEACEFWIETTSRRLSFEWALIDGVNDTDQALEELARYAASLRAHVNLIPLNPTPGYLVRGSTPERVRQFRDGLEAEGINVTVRNTRGRSIDAACGQLANVTNAKRRSIPVRSA